MMQTHIAHGTGRRVRHRAGRFPDAPSLVAMPAVLFSATGPLPLVAAASTPGRPDV